MSSDQRWQGGVANRTWQAGTRPTPQVDTDHLIAEVRRYLADCKKFRLTPSEDDAAKVIFGPATAIRAAYQQVTQPPAVTQVRPCCDHCNNGEGDPAGHDYTLDGPHDGPCEQCAAEKARREHDEGTG